MCRCVCVCMCVCRCGCMCAHRFAFLFQGSFQYAHTSSHIVLVFRVKIPPATHVMCGRGPDCPSCSDRVSGCGCVHSSVPPPTPACSAYRSASSPPHTCAVMPSAGPHACGHLNLLSEHANYSGQASVIPDDTQPLTSCVLSLCHSYLHLPPPLLLLLLLLFLS